MARVLSLSVIAIFLLPSIMTTAVSLEPLFTACTANNVSSLRELLQDATYSSKALEKRDFVEKGNSELPPPPKLNLIVMFDKAATAGCADVIEGLLSFANSHGIPYDTLVARNSIVAAIECSNNVAVFEKFLAVMPSVVNENLGHLGVS